MTPNQLSSLIPHDDLQWNETEKRYAALSDDEICKILETCLTGNIDSEESCISVVRWAEHVRSANHLLNGVLNDRLGISMLEGMEEPAFWNKEKKKKKKKKKKKTSLVKNRFFC